jgi:hypothetical protein
MKHLLTLSLSLLLSGAALAQQPAPPKFVPFTVDEQAYNAVTNALLELKVKDGLPILNWINQLEQKAQQMEASKAAEVAKHPVEPAK